MQELCINSQDAILRLQHEMAKMPQVQLETKHYFADGMYCRELFRPKGVTIVGKVHKREHFYMVLQGRVLVMDGDSHAVERAAPCILVSKPGTKRAVYALEDSTCVTVHRTFETDLDLIERELIEPDETALFDASNRIKNPELEQL